MLGIVEEIVRMFVLAYLEGVTAREYLVLGETTLI